MNRTHKYISLLLERLPKYELRSYEHQTSLDRIRDRFSSTEDIQAELLALYKVHGFADFALSLMWVADKVEKDSTKEESTIGEETLVFSKFRQAVGDESPPVQDSGTAGSMFDLPGSQESEPTSIPARESAFGLPSQPVHDSFSTVEPSIDAIFGASAQPHEQPQSMSSGSPSVIDQAQEQRFAVLLERFLESVQSGHDDRTTLSADIIQECNTVITAGSVEEDYQQFCKSLIEFLQYISVNQYLDDVRVMNILSNIQDPFAQWARTDPDSRTGILGSVNDTLRDFKSMFE
jgi:hypothetical protein